MRLHNSLVCKKCQVKPLVEDIKANRKRINISGKRTQREGGGLEKSDKEHFLVCILYIFALCLLLLVASQFYITTTFKNRN